MEKLLMVLKQVFALLIPYFKKPDSTVGVAETKEALVGFNEVGLVMAEILKDGVSFDDAIAFYNKLIADEKMKEVIMKAYDNYQAIPDEVKDIDLGEGMELADVQLDYIPKYLDLFWLAHILEPLSHS